MQNRANQATSSQPSYRIKSSTHPIALLSTRSKLTALITAVLLLMVIVFGIKEYRTHLQQRYTYNYVQAVYGIKSGMAMADRICEGSYTAWKDGKSVAGATSMNSDSRALEDVRTIKTEVDSCISALGNPPEEYQQAHHTLKGLYALYGSRHEMVVSSLENLSRCDGDFSAVNDVFAREITNLKMQMPAALQTEFKKAARKYDLAFMGLK